MTYTYVSVDMANGKWQSHIEAIDMANGKWRSHIEAICHLPFTGIFLVFVGVQLVPINNVVNTTDGN
jgi:hypothetical protein